MSALLMACPFPTRPAPPEVPPEPGVMPQRPPTEVPTSQKPAPKTESAPTVPKPR